MQTPVTILNNFLKLKDDFKADTGFEFNKENMSLYIQYFNARMNDKSYQTIHTLTEKLINKIDFLPDQIRLRIAEMITTHPTIKQLLKSNP
jgi:hypothetical protein